MTKNNSLPNRERRRAEAQERQAEYDALSLKERMSRVFNRPGNSSREQSRIWALIEKAERNR